MARGFTGENGLNWSERAVDDVCGVCVCVERELALLLLARFVSLVWP